MHALQARGGVRVLEATRLAPAERVALDGRLDEVFWRRAPVADGFLQQEPVEGQAPTERTEVRVAYDADNLYIGALLHDSDPDGILGYQRQRDQELDSDDRFMLVLDTFLDGRTAYYFETNPAGLMGDGLVRNTGYARVNKAWDGVWEARTARGAFGWSAEIRIPFRTLNFDESSETWGINFQRTVRRKNEELVWSGHRRNQGLLRPIHAGRLTGLRDLTQGLGLEVVPYGAATWRAGAGIPTAIPLDAGVDMNYSVTSNLRAAVTVNTDFAEAEVDRRRVNLTRFPLFYPEQRDFFLENASIFEFAPLNAVNPYFSRRIGLDEGQVIPIEYGTRLAGQAGANDLGFLQIRTGPAGGRPAEDFTVARVKRNFFAQSSIGFLYTRRAAGAGEHGPGEHGPAAPDRHTVGVDLDLFTSTFLGDKNLQFQTFYVVHTDPERGGIAGGAADRASRGFRDQLPERRVAGAPLVPRVRRAVGPGRGVRAAPRVPPLQSGRDVRAPARLVRQRAPLRVPLLLRAPDRPGQPAADPAHGTDAAGRRVGERRPLRPAPELPLRAARGAVRDTSGDRAADRRLRVRRLGAQRGDGQPPAHLRQRVGGGRRAVVGRARDACSSD